MRLQQPDTKNRSVVKWMKKSTIAISVSVVVCMSVLGISYAAMLKNQNACQQSSCNKAPVNTNTPKDIAQKNIVQVEREQTVPQTTGKSTANSLSIVKQPSLNPKKTAPKKVETPIPTPEPTQEPTPEPTAEPTQAPQVTPTPDNTQQGTATGDFIPIVATAYSDTGAMANGQKTFNGACAVYPSQIPMGTVFNIYTTDKQLIQQCTATDTGGDITFGRIDIAMPGREGDAVNWGRRNVLIKIVK